jgi:hypothetical protein
MLGNRWLSAVCRSKQTNIHHLCLFLEEKQKWKKDKIKKKFSFLNVFYFNLIMCYFYFLTKLHLFFFFCLSLHMTEGNSLVHQYLPSYIKAKKQKKKTEDDDDDDNVEIGLVPTRQTHLVISEDTNEYIPFYF